MFVAQGLIDFQVGTFVRVLPAEIAIVGDDHVGHWLFADTLLDETGASADACYHADSPKGERFEVGDAEGFINALAEFDIGAPAKIHEIHVGGHACTAKARSPAELID